MPALYLLYESAHGYALLEAYGLDAIGGTSVDGVQKSVTELDRFGKVRKRAEGACGERVPPGPRLEAARLAAGLGARTRRRSNARPCLARRVRAERSRHPRAA